MKLGFKCLLLVLIMLNVSFAQQKDEVLLKVDGEPVMTSEFLRVYNKNLDLVKHESQKDYSKGFGGKYGVQTDRKDKVHSDFCAL